MRHHAVERCEVLVGLLPLAVVVPNTDAGAVANRAGVIALVAYLDEIEKQDHWKFEDNYATPLIGALATAFSRMAVGS